MIFPKRTSKGHHQSDQHWNCFRGSIGKTERWGGAHIMGSLECIDTRLNWSEPNWTCKWCGSLSSRQLHTNIRSWIYSRTLSFRQWHTRFRGWMYSSSLHWNEHWSTFALAWIVTCSHIIADSVFRLWLWGDVVHPRHWLHPFIQPLSELHMWQLHCPLSPSVLSASQLCLLPAHGPTGTVLSQHVSPWVLHEEIR